MGKSRNTTRLRDADVGVLLFFVPSSPDFLWASQSTIEFVSVLQLSHLRIK